MLLILAPAAVQADQEVPGALLQHGLHVPHQLDAGRGPHGGHSEASVGVASHKADRDRHGLIYSKLLTTLLPLSVPVSFLVLERIKFREEKKNYSKMNSHYVYMFFGRNLDSGNHGVRSGLRADDVVRGEARAGVHVSLHPCHPDHGRHDRLLLSP